MHTGSKVSARLGVPHWARFILISSGLVLLTFVTFHSVIHHEFIKYDDRQYITENPHVTSGLTWSNVKWAFTTGYASNWHPMTWISHMCDVQLYGLRPGGHHSTNLLFHVANTVLLFVLLQFMTHRVWPAATVAALFAVHPLHVESVAWVAERKDVLSTFFFLLTLGAYALYARRAADRALADGGPRTGRAGLAAGWPRGAFLGFYFLALALFALGLMSKPMLVTLPFLLLLLDWWPLNRFDPASSRSQKLGLIFEKLPFLALAVLSCIVTFISQAGSHSVTAGLPLGLRLENAVVSYLKYVAKTCWPSHLAIFYPHPDTRYGLPATLEYPSSEQWPWWCILAGALALAAISVAAFWRSRKQPWFFTGWFWFLGTLVPVIGVIQVGMQGMADRYTYIPLIGIFVAVVWAVCELLEKRPIGRGILPIAGIAVVGLCALGAARQTEYWRNNYTLFEHAMAVTRHNAVAECNVGEELAQQNKLERARELFVAAQKADPRYPLAYMDLALLFELQGKLDQALPQYQATVQLRPWNESSRLRLASALKNLGHLDEALAQYAQILQLNSKQPSIHYEMARILVSQGKIPDAMGHLREALNLRPSFADALLELGTLLASQGKFSEAQAPLRQAAALSATNALIHLELGKALMLGGKEAEATAQFKEVSALDPRLGFALLEEGRQLRAKKQLNAALVRFNTALWLMPDSPEALSQMAWALATHPVAQFRNGTRALRLAQRAVEVSGGKLARAWAAMDVAFAELGRFPEAISAAQKAGELALAGGDAQTAQDCEARIALYQNQRAFHE